MADAERRQIDSSRAGTRTRQKPRLTREAIAVAAIDLVERRGVDALTMRSLADDLGCAPMSLYTHVQNRDDLIASIVAALIARLDTAAVSEEGWQGTLRRALASYRDLAVQAPRSFELLALAPYDRSPVTGHLAGFVATLERGGLTPQQAGQVLAIADAYATGFLVVWARSAGIGRAPGDEVQGGIADLRSLAMFDRGLDALIAGLEATI